MKKDPIFCIALVYLAFYMAFLLIGPIGLIISYSLHGRDYYGGITAAWSLEGWKELVSASVLEIIARTTLMAGLNTVICALIGVPLSLAIYFQSPKIKRIWMILFILPMLVNSLLVSYSWQVLLGNKGIINSALISIGIINDPLPLLYTPGAIMIGLFSTYLVFFVIAFLISLERLEEVYIIASYSLGANYFKTLFKVILPMTKPGLLTGCLLVFLPSFGEYVIPDLLGGGKTHFIGNLAQFSFYDGRNWPMGAAFMVVLVALLLIFTIFIVRYLRGVFSVD